MPIERIEVYLDNGPEPVQVLTQAPYKITYDTRSLPDGEHQLKVVTRYTNGAREVKEIPFKVANTPGVLVQGLDEGTEVSGNLDVTVRVADPEVKATPDRFPGLAAALATAVILGGVWLFFAATGATNDTIAEVAPPAKEGSAQAGHGGTATAAAPVDAALKTQGEGVYTANCAGCHQANGAGLPPALPKLAGAPGVGDVKNVVSHIHKGQGSMPAFPQLSAAEVAAVSTYIRNSWGNSFGGVSTEEVQKLFEELSAAPSTQMASR